MSKQQDHVALDSICSINPPLGFKPPAETIVTYLPMEHIAEGGGQLHAETRRRDAIPNGLTPFQNDDVLIAKITPCFENMKGWLAQGLCSGVGFGSTELHVIRAGPKVLPRIIYAHSLSPRFRRLGARFMTGSAGQQRVSADFLRAYRILLPSLAAQHRIASIDEQLESALRLTDALIAAKREQKRGLMQQLLTGKVRFPGFTEPWKTVAIGDLVEEHARKVVWDDERIYRLISIRRRNGGVFPREELPGSKILTKSLFSVETGDLLVSCRQVVHGAIAVVPSELSGSCVSGEYLCMRERKGAQVDSGFLNLLAHLPAMRKLTMNCSYGVHIEKLNLDVPKFMRSKVHVAPTLEEQLRIVRIFNLIEHELTLLQVQRVALASQRRGLMENLLSGDISIPSSNTSAA